MNSHHISQSQITPSGDLPVLQKLAFAYKLWQGIAPHISRMTRYSLGAKIDNLFTDCIEQLLLASYTNREHKLKYIVEASNKVDFLKYFIQLVWELKAINNNKYISLSTPLTEVGKMLGGWRKQNESQPPADLRRVG